MSESSLRDRYLEIINHIVDITLQGKIRSKEQVYKLLVKGIEPGTGEIFERCLQEKKSATEAQLETKTKAPRILRALQMIEGEWQRWQQENQTQAAIADATQKIVAAEKRERLNTLIQIIDPNQTDVLTIGELNQLATTLKQEAQSRNEPDLAALAQGIRNGLASWQRLEGDIVSWIYEGGRGSLGFGQIVETKGPWALWASKVDSLSLSQLFQTLASDQSLVELAPQLDLEPTAWTELAIVLQYLQRGLSQFFDQRVYNSQLGTKLSIATFLTFAVIWSGLANGLNQIGASRDYARSCFQITLQILRTFASRDYFPLYGGMFASFTGKTLKDVISYLDEPLRQAEGTQAKARILTLLGYSAQAQSQSERAIGFHEQALEIAAEAGDRSCEIANLNHLSRTYIAQKNYAQALSYSQRALVMSRQGGDRLGQANALSNLGYSEVLQAQQLERMEPEVYETAISYLQQGLELSEKQQDRQSQALCCSSLGIAYVILERPQAAMQSLSKGLEAANFAGDLYFQGLNFAYLAEAHYQLSQFQQAVVTGCLGMYLLEQTGANEWRQAAGLLTVLQSQSEDFGLALQKGRSEIIAVIGVDGYDYLPQLLEKYAQQ